MPDIVSRSLFSGDGEPNPTDLGSAEVTNFHSDIVYHRERILETSTLSCNEEEEITNPPTR